MSATLQDFQDVDWSAWDRLLFSVLRSSGWIDVSHQAAVHCKQWVRRTLHSLGIALTLKAGVDLRRPTANLSQGGPATSAGSVPLLDNFEHRFHSAVSAVGEGAGGP